MITLLLAWISAKYDWGGDLLFIGTLILDIEIIQAIQAALI